MSQRTGPGRGGAGLGGGAALAGGAGLGGTGPDRALRASLERAFGPALETAVGVELSVELSAEFLDEFLDESLAESPDEFSAVADGTGIAGTEREDLERADKTDLQTGSNVRDRKRVEGAFGVWINAREKITSLERRP
jgi:hypothetical protein